MQKNGAERPFFCFFQIVRKLLVQQIVAGLGLLFLSVSHWFPLGINILELLAAFAHFTAIGSIVIVVFSAWKKYSALVILSLASLVLSCSLVIPQILPSSFSGQENQFTVGQFNMYHHNDAVNESIDAVLLSQADVLSIQELNAHWSAELKEELKSSHPFVIEEAWDNCCYGIGLYSKFPIVSYQIAHYDGIPAIVAILNVNGKKINLISLHTQTPAFPNKTHVRNAQMNLIVDILEQNEKPSIVIGDFNIVPWDGFYKQFLKQAELKRVRSGLQATFPMDLGIPLIPIDHIMYSQEMEPTSCQTVLIPGSDHKGLVAGFRFK